MNLSQEVQGIGHHRQPRDPQIDITSKILEILRQTKIMAKKSKGFRDLLRQEQRLRGQQEASERLAQRVQENLPEKATLIRNPDGEAKVSDALKEFIRPYLKITRNREQRLKLLTIAAFAWNLTLLPQEKQSEEMENLISQVAGSDRLAQEDTREILAELIERKRTHFGDHQRFIVDFELKEDKKDIHLSVVSTLMPPRSE